MPQRWSRWLVGVPAAALPFLFGGVQEWVWSFTAGIFFIGVLILLWMEPRLTLTGNFSRKWMLVMGLILAYPMLQILPLPMPALNALSPERALWLGRAAEFSRLPVSSAGISYVPLTTFFLWIWWVFLLIYALVLRNVLGEEKNSSRFFGLLFFLAGLEAFYGLLQVLIPSIGVLWAGGGGGLARGTFINRNHYAAFLGMLWPVLLTCILYLGKDFREGTVPTYSEAVHGEGVRHKQFFLSFIIGLILLSLFFSRSRGGIIGSLVALSVLVSFGALRRKGMSVFVIGCWLVMFAYGSIIGFDEILIRFDRLSDESAGRFSIWNGTRHLILDHPLTGTGLGGYGTVFRVYQTHLAENLKAGHAHNDYLELIADLGFPAATAIILLVWGYWIYQARSIARSRDKRRLIRVGALAGSAAFLCQSGVEFNWQIPANQLVFVVLLVLMGEGGNRLWGTEFKEFLDMPIMRR